MDRSAYKRLAELTQSLLNITVASAKGAIYITDAVSWRHVINKIISLLSQQQIPTSYWQIGRLYKHVAHKCLVKERSRAIGELLKDGMVDSEQIKKHALTSRLPLEMVREEFLNIFSRFPHKYRVYVPINKINLPSPLMNISGSIKVHMQEGELDEKLAQLNNTADGYDFLEDEPDTLVGSQCVKNKKERRIVNIPGKRIDRESINKYSYLSIDIEGLFYESVKHEPELTIIRSRMRQLLSIFHLLNFIDYFPREDRDGDYLLVDDITGGEGGLFVLSLAFEELDAFKAMRFKKGFIENNQFDLMKRLFEDDSYDAKRILVALDWYGHSLIKQYDESDEVFEYISCMVAIEALLGDEKPRVSMTEQLANRVSYLLGNTSETRENIRTLFIDLYGFRSKILHGRVSFPDEKYHDLQNALRDLVSDLFVKEFENYMK